MSAPTFTSSMIRSRFEEKVASGEVPDNPKIRGLLEAFLDSPQAAEVLAADNAAAPGARTAGVVAGEQVDVASLAGFAASGPTAPYQYGAGSDSTTLGDEPARAVGYSDPGADPADEWDRAGDRAAPVMWGRDNGEGEAFIPLPETVLDEAARIVSGQRAQDYGENSLPHVARVWSAYLGVPVTGRMVGWMLAQMKMVRDLHKPKRDNPVDIAGYAHLADQSESAA